jgi:hypothetical protein
VLELTFKGQLASLECSLKVVEELPAEYSAEDFDVNEEVLSRRDPLLSVGRESSARDDTMDVRVRVEPLTPGVEDSQEADSGTEVFGVLGDLEKRLGRGTKEEAVDETFVL